MRVQPPPSVLIAKEAYPRFLSFKITGRPLTQAQIASRINYYQTEDAQEVGVFFLKGNSMLPFKIDCRTVEVPIGKLYARTFQISDLILNMEALDITAEIILISSSLSNYSYLLKNAKTVDGSTKLYSCDVIFEEEPLPDGVVGRIQILSNSVPGFYVEALFVETVL